MPVTYIIYVSSGPVLPAEMDERVVRLLDVHLTFAFVWGHRISLHGHLASTKLHQVLTGGAARPRHHAGEQSSRRHDEELLEGQAELNPINTDTSQDWIPDMLDITVHLLQNTSLLHICSCIPLNLYILI